MLVLMMMLNCATDTEKMAGSIRPITRRTSLSLNAARGEPMRSRRPIRRSAAHCSPSCSAPPISTAKASDMIGCDSRGASHSAQPMNETFSSTGVKAGTAKRR